MPLFRHIGLGNKVPVVLIPISSPIEENLMSKDIAVFSATWGRGKPDFNNGESKEHFEYKAGSAAIKDIQQYGTLCRTREGDLYFTSTELPWKLVPLVHDDPRLIALITHV